MDANTTSQRKPTGHSEFEHNGVANRLIDALNERDRCIRPEYRRWEGSRLDIAAAGLAIARLEADGIETEEAIQACVELFAGRPGTSRTHHELLSLMYDARNS